MRTPLFLGISALALSGCSSIGGKAPAIAAKPLPSRLDEIAYINTLRSAMVLGQDPDQGSMRPDPPKDSAAETKAKSPEAGAATPTPSKVGTQSAATTVKKGGSELPMLCFDGEGLPAFKTKHGQGFRRGREKEQYVDGSGKDTCVNYRKVPDDASGEKLIRTYLDAGFGLTDIYCRRFFTVAIAAQRDREFTRSGLASADTLVGAVLGASGAGETAMTITNAAFGFSGKLIEGYDRAFLVKAEMEDVDRLVQAEQYRFREEVSAKFAKGDWPRSYEHARAVIESYARNCSYSGMQSLVSLAVKDRAEGLVAAKDAKKEEQPPNSSANSGDGQPATPTPDKPDKQDPSTGGLGEVLQFNNYSAQIWPDDDKKGGKNP